MGLIFQSNLIISPLEPRCSFVDKFLPFDIIIFFNVFIFPNHCNFSWGLYSVSWTGKKITILRLFETCLWIYCPYQWKGLIVLFLTEEKQAKKINFLLLRMINGVKHMPYILATEIQGRK